MTESEYVKLSGKAPPPYTATGPMIPLPTPPEHRSGAVLHAYGLNEAQNIRSAALRVAHAVFEATLDTLTADDLIRVAIYIETGELNDA